LAAHDRADRFSNGKFRLSQLPGGLPADFDYGFVKTPADAKKLILLLPSCDRGEAAVGLYNHYDLIGAETAHTGLMVAWDHDHRDVVDAFGSPERFVAALKEVAPPQDLNLPTRINVWRGIVANRNDLLDRSIGLSWTRSRGVACWFALRDYVPALQPSLIPIVLRANIERSVIVALHNVRAEREAILDVCRLRQTDSAITLDGLFELSLNECPERLIDICPNNNVFDHLIAGWRPAAARYQHWKSRLELRRNLAANRAKL
jgi:hypothetical protein